MSAWPPQIGSGPGPKYRRLADAIARAIRSGELPPGARLPSHRDLAYQLGMAVGSVARAYEELTGEGMVRGEVGRGTVVRDPDEAGWIPLVRRPGSTDLGLVTAPPVEDPALREAAGPRTLATLAAQWSLLALGEFAPERGEARHRRAAAEWLRRGHVPAAEDATFITVGAQEALASALVATARRGGPVLAERLTFASLRDLAGTLGLALRPVAMDGQGADPDDLARRARRHGAEVAVLQPGCQVPTGARMDEERRRRIAAAATRAGITVIEYDAWAAVAGYAASPLAALAPERTIHVQALSHDLMPGLGAGLASVPPALAERFVAARHALVLSTPRLIAEAATHWIVSGVADALAAAAASVCERRTALARRAAPALGGVVHPRAPFLWADVSPRWSARDYAREAGVRGVTVLPAARFAINPGRAPERVRVALSSAADDADLARALRVLNALKARSRRERPARG